MRFSSIILAAFLMSFSWKADAQQGWFTPAVAATMGIETCAICPAPEFETTLSQVGSSTFYVKRLAVFDTIASFARGRIVDKRTHQSIKGARVLIQFCSVSGTKVESKETLTDENGLFVIGWVGSRGTKGIQSNRLVAIQALGYENISSTAVAFGASAYLHVELASVRKRH